MQAAKDYRTDADLHSACEPDAKQLCANVNAGQGRIQVKHCSDHMTDVSAVMCFTGDALSECVLLHHLLKLPLGKRKAAVLHC